MIIDIGNSKKSTRKQLELKCICSKMQVSKQNQLYFLYEEQLEIEINNSIENISLKHGTHIYPYNFNKICVRLLH